MPPSPVHLREPGPDSRLGPYRIEDRLGEGGMGVVYRATRERDGAVVALKILREELAEEPTYLRRFVREGDVAATLEHPNLVEVLERGEADGWHYLASRYVPGPSLDERIQARALPPAEVARIVAHVGAALDALHRLGLVHRDVKPGNVLLDPSGRALLTDFGVARAAAHSTLTKAGRVVGTPDYLAPELIRGEPATPSTDIYALGCVAYAALAGAPPFADRPLAATYLAHLRGPPPALTSSAVSADVDAVVRTALAKDPARRPATGSAYGRLLRAAVRAR
jgi:eukaryotic-like serine/threonine-protein kinase